MKKVVSVRGQITVPKAIRDRLGLAPGTELEMDLAAGGFVARKITAQSPWRAALGILKRLGSTDKLMQQLRGRPDAIDEDEAR